MTSNLTHTPREIHSERATPTSVIASAQGLVKTCCTGDTAVQAQATGPAPEPRTVFAAREDQEVLR